MKIKFILFLLLFSGTVVSQDKSSSTKVEFFRITEAYLIKGDSIYTMHKMYVDQPSGILLMPEGDSILISVDHGGIDSVVYLGYSYEVEDPGVYDFLKGDKKFYHWHYIEAGVKEKQDALVIKKHRTKVEYLSIIDYYVFHCLFEHQQIMFYCAVVKGPDEL